MTTATVDREQELKEESHDIVVQAQGFEIQNTETFTLASEFLKTAIMAGKKKVHDAFDSIVDAAYRTHKEATAKRKEFLDPLENAERLLKGKLATYSMEQDRIAQEAQRKAQAEAEALAAKERAKLQAQAEKAAKAGNIGKAEELLSQQEQVVAAVPVIESEAPKVSGIKMIEKWTGQITDPMALVKAIADGKAPIDWIEWEQGEINRYAASTKGKMPVPGIIFRADKVVAAGSR